MEANETNYSSASARSLSAKTVALIAAIVVLAVAVIALVYFSRPAESTVVQEDVSALELSASNVKEARAAAEEAIEQVAEPVVADGIELDEAQKIKVDEDSTVYRFDMQYNGVEVYGKTAVLETEDGQASQLTVDTEKISSVDMTENLDANQAMEVAECVSLNAAGTSAGISPFDASKAAGESAADSSHNAIVIPQGKVIYSLHGVEPTLCYKFLVTENGACSYVFVSAKDGKVVAGESLVRTVRSTGSAVSALGVKHSFATEYEDGLYILHDSSRNITAYDLHGKELTGVPYWLSPKGKVYLYAESLGCYVNAEDAKDKLEAKDIAADWALPAGFIPTTKDITLGANKTKEWKTSPIVVAYDLVSSAHSFYQSLGRNGFSNLGAKAETSVFVNDGTFQGTNAFQAFGELKGITVISIGSKFNPTPDVVFHECTHGVEGSISHLSYMSESGAIMEAVSDIMGEIGEDYYKDGKIDGNNDWTVSNIRNLRDPQTRLLNSGSKNPIKYQGDGWGDPSDKKMDNGFVHGNSTVLSHAFYLMCASKDLAGEKLTNADMATLILDTLTVISRQDCTFQEFASLMVNQAEKKLSAQKVNRIKAAFDSANVKYTLPSASK